MEGQRVLVSNINGFQVREIFPPGLNEQTYATEAMKNPKIRGAFEAILQQELRKLERNAG